MQIAAKTMYFNCKTILGHNTNDLDTKTLSKNKIFQSYVDYYAIFSKYFYFARCTKCKGLI